MSLPSTAPRNPDRFVWRRGDFVVTRPGEKAFDPREARDPHGRWERGGSEWQALSTWTGAQSHEIQQGYQAGQPVTDLAKRFDRALMGLAPLPRRSVLRALNVDLRDPAYPSEPLTKPEDVAAHYRARIGETLEVGHPQSATTAPQNIEQLSLGPGARVAYEIDTSRARSLEGYAAHREAWESEVVIPPGRFKIEGVELRGFPIVDPFAGRRRGGQEQVAVVKVRDVTKD